MTTDATLATEERTTRLADAYRLYVYAGLSMTATARRSGVPESTLRRVAHREGWDAAREAWDRADRGIADDVAASLTALGEKAREGDVKAVTGLLAIQRELRHVTDPRSVVVEFATALVTMLENDGHPQEAALVAVYLERAAGKVVE